jgi:hypothetical protein
MSASLQILFNTSFVNYSTIRRYVISNTYSVEKNPQEEEEEENIYIYIYISLLKPKNTRVRSPSSKRVHSLEVAILSSWH